MYTLWWMTTRNIAVPPDRILFKKNLEQHMLALRKVFLVLSLIHAIITCEFLSDSAWCEQVSMINNQLLYAPQIWQSMKIRQRCYPECSRLSFRFIFRFKFRDLFRAKLKTMKISADVQTFTICNIVAIHTVASEFMISDTLATKCRLLQSMMKYVAKDNNWHLQNASSSESCEWYPMCVSVISRILPLLRA